MSNRRTFTAEKPSRGFSLVELMVVVVIVGILLGIGIPLSSRTISDARVRGTADRLAQNMREARERAVARGHQVALAFGSTGNQLNSSTVYLLSPNVTVSTDNYGNCNLGLRADDPPTSRPPDSLPAGAPAAGIDFAGNQALFSPQGGCSPGAIYLFSRDGRIQMAVTVNINGRVRTWRWDNGAWY